MSKTQSSWSHQVVNLPKRALLVVAPLMVAFGCDTVRVRPAIDDEQVASDDSAPEADVGLAAVSLGVGPYTQCAALEDGSLWCWGSGRFGLLGGASGPGPVRIEDAENVTRVWVGERLVCYLAGDALRCHGERERGAVRNEGASLPELSDVTAVAIGAEHLCAITAAGDVRCLGSNDHNESGTAVRGRYHTARFPGAVMVEQASDVAVGRHHSCATSPRGVECWGAASLARLATDQIRYYTPTAMVVAGVTSARSVSANPMGALTCALSSDSDIACWGSTGLTAADGSFVALTPKTLPAIEGRVVDVAVGINEVYAVTESGALMLFAPTEALGRASTRRWSERWGDQNESGGVTAPEQPFEAPRVLSLEDVVEVGAGMTTTCARTDEGAIYCFGARAREPARVRFEVPDSEATAPEGEGG